jgi:hypothetical protein
MLFLLFLACRIPSSSPYLGECAEYPEGVYDYGQIGIGSCLAGAAEMTFQQNQEGKEFLLLTNSNPYVLFSGGSFMSIAWNNIDLTSSINYIQDLEVNTLQMPNFNGPIAITEDNIALLGVRHSEDARARVHDDNVYIVDVSDPESLEYLPLGPMDNNYITTKSDPVDVVIDNNSGLAFVANRTSHDISIVDTTKDSYTIVPPWPLEVLGESSFLDNDDSKSYASFETIEDLSESSDDDTITIGNLTDDVWSFDWVEGTWRLWLPDQDGFFRIDTIGDGEYTPSGFGTEFTLFEQTPITPYYLDGTMYYSSDGNIGIASWDISTQSWVLINPALLSSSEITYTSPSWLIDDENLTLLYAAEDSQGWWIGSASYDEGGNLRVDNEPLIIPEASERISEPFVVMENLVGQWRLYYSVFDGDSWQIEQQRSSDGQTWTKASTFSIEGIDVAAPVISEEVDRFRMWYARKDLDLWDIAYAESLDGENWVDHGVIYHLQDPSEEPPRIALNAYPTTAFRLSGENAGYQDLVEVNSTFSSIQYGWTATPIAGQWVDTGVVGADSSGGISLTSFLPDTGVGFFEISNDTGDKKIASGSIESSFEDLTIIIENTENSVFSPVVWTDDDGYHMLHAIQQGEQSSIALSSSTDGQTWTDGSIVLEPAQEWESLAIVPNSIEITDTGYQLLYSGTDGRVWSIGRAISNDGITWEKDTTPFFALGKAGSWDDSGVQEGFITTEENTTHLWYSGFDGDTWRIGYAYRDGDDEWQRNDGDEYSIPSFGLFFTDGSRRPVVWKDDEQTHLWYTGYSTDHYRVGRAVGSSNKKLRQVYKHPTVGDVLQFETHKGDDEAVSITLDTNTEEASLSGVGLTALAIDEERGFVYAVSKLMPYIIVIDARDDSQGDFIDRNYLDIEAVITASTSSGAVGFRQILPVAEKDYIYALNDSPEAVFILDMSKVIDDEYSDLIRDVQVGWLPTPVGVEQDQGERTRMSIGPGQMVLDEQLNRLFVSNFNANSISVFDLSMGPYGEEIAEIPTNGENPYALVPSPDNNYLVVSNYTGEITSDSQANTTLSIIDINPSSPEYLTLITQVVNQ